MKKFAFIAAACLGLFLLSGCYYEYGYGPNQVDDQYYSQQAYGAWHMSHPNLAYDYFLAYVWANAMMRSNYYHSVNIYNFPAPMSSYRYSYRSYPSYGANSRVYRSSQPYRWSSGTSSGSKSFYGSTRSSRSVFSGGGYGGGSRSFRSYSRGRR